MHLETNQLLLRPVTLADTTAIADVVFSDPDVVAMLAHNTRLKEDALREAERWISGMGIDGSNSIWEDGGVGLFAVTPKVDTNRSTCTGSRAQHLIWLSLDLSR